MAIFRRMLALFRRSSVDREIDAELREHMQMSIDDNMARGMAWNEAAREARLRFGSPLAMHERVSAEDAALGLDRLFRDVRYALRGFLNSPGFAIVAILTLALGIGANTAVFQLIDAVRLRSLPIQRPDELAELRIAGGNKGFGVNSRDYEDFTIPMWQEIRRNHDPFSGVFAWHTEEPMLGKLSDARHVHGLEVSGEFFRVLGVAPWQGRLIEMPDEGPCGWSKVVVSYSFWKSEMGGAPITPSTTLVINGQTVQVLGVTQPSFFGMVVGQRFDVAYPTCTPQTPRREYFQYSVMGRLKPGWTLARASGYLASLSPGLFERAAPDGYNSEAIKMFKSFRLEAGPAGAGVSPLRKAYDSSLQLLLAITGLVLLIACANLANLMLARASVRQREIAIRMALGATRGRLLRQMLIESGLLAVCGAGLGVALAQPLSRLLVKSLDTSQSSIQLTVETDWRVLLFAAAVAALTCVIFGTFPAVRSAGADPITALRSGERGVVGSRERFSVQRLMVVTQIAISMVLLVGALLFVGSYRKLMTLNPGMRESGITIAYFDYETLHIKPEDEGEFKRRLVDDLRGVAGVQNAAVLTQTPLTGGSWTHGVRVGANEGSSKFNYVSPSYFATIDIPLLMGRNFTDLDTNSAPLVLIVNQTFVRKFLGAGQPLGKTIHVMPEPQYPERTYQVVGTIPDTKYNNLRDETPPMAFVPIAQLPVTAQGPWAAMMIASNDPAATVNAVRRMVAAKYPEMILQLEDFQQDIRDTLVGDRMMARLSGSFGVLAAVLVVVGLYGVLSYLLAQRRNEIGIRIALGASRMRVVGLVLRDTAGMLLTGLVAGMAFALIAGRGASSMLFGMKAWDPATLGYAALLLAAVALLTSWIPAHKAANLDPVDALRSE